MLAFNWNNHMMLHEVIKERTLKALESHQIYFLIDKRHTHYHHRVTVWPKPRTTNIYKGIPLQCRDYTPWQSSKRRYLIRPQTSLAHTKGHDTKQDHR